MPIEEIKDNTSIENLDDWDSLAHVQVITRLEKILNRSLEVDDLIQAVDIKGIEMVLSKAK